ncbi:hypothetical protein RBB78_23205 [Tunturiibacter empetritectus]|uniref:hypothetical protein n=1 Tax=Tunturiibacter empetritectus TaxID=3069691 RepID=UPI003D9AC1A6
MESSGEGDRLEVGCDACCVIAADEAAGGIGVGSWNRGMPAYVETGNRLQERRVLVDVGVGNAAIRGPEAGVDGELGEVGETLLAGGSSRGAAWDGGKWTEVDGLGPFDSR